MARREGTKIRLSNPAHRCWFFKQEGKVRILRDLKTARLYSPWNDRLDPLQIAWVTPQWGDQTPRMEYRIGYYSAGSVSRDAAHEYYHKIMDTGKGRARWDYDWERKK